MTTFQRFQRNQRSHLSLSQNSKKAPESYGSLKIRELVRFSQKQIYFQYNEDLSCKASLKITNLSGSRIHFKVRSNNPSMYRVTPFQQIIQDQQQSTVCFEYLYKQKSEEFLQRQRIKKDKFQIIWGKLSNNPGQRNVLSESKIFNAHFSNHPQTQFSQPSLSQIKSTHKVNSPFDLNQYSNNRQRNPQATQSLLRKDIIIGVSLVSFFLGFILT